MSKKFLSTILIFIFAFVNNPTAEAGWTDYFTEGWEAMSNYVTGWFYSSEDEKPEDENVNQNSQNQEPISDYIASDWDKLTNSLTGALARRDNQENLPSSAWFGEDQKSNAKKINQLMDAALSILIQGNAINIRKEANDLRNKITALRIELDDTRNKRITAPESSMLPGRLTRTKADKQIEHLELEIKENEELLQEINARLIDAMKEIGLELDEQQIEILLNSVTGDDLLNNTVIFSNVKSVVTKLEDLAKNDTSFEINKRYTGMYLILNELLIYTQQGLLQKIEAEYKPRINAIVTEAAKLRDDAKARSTNKQYSQAQRSGFKMNAEANDLTVRVGKLYIDLLNSQRNGIVDSIKNLSLNRDLAESTYKTVRSSGELRNLIHSGLNVFDNVNALAMPQLKIFENQNLRHEFEEINKRLKIKEVE